MHECYTVVYVDAFRYLNEARLHEWSYALIGIAYTSRMNARIEERQARTAASAERFIAATPANRGKSTFLMQIGDSIGWIGLIPASAFLELYARHECIRLSNASHMTCIC